MADVLVNRIVKDLDETYRVFLQDMELPDTPVVKLGFCVAAVHVVTANPIPESKVQAGVVKYLQEKQYEALTDESDDLLDSIKLTHLQVSGNAAVKRRKETEAIRQALMKNPNGSDACDG
jgi:hypothetical protein